tara:strand:- start:1426 stop:1932 length:507 start_codon:yes stop_codon:yes gene_type:complete
MAFKMKYGKGKGFPFKKVDDIQTQNKIMADIKTAVEEGRSDSEIADIVDSQTDFATTYVYNPKTGAARTTETKTKEGTSSETGRFDIKSMDTLYKVGEEGYESVSPSSTHGTGTTKSRTSGDGERTTTSFEVPETGRKGKSKHETHNIKDLSTSGVSKIRRSEGFHEF